MESKIIKCSSLKKKCLQLIGQNDEFSAQSLTGVPRELLEKLTKYCSPTQLLKFKHIFRENDIDISWNWRNLTSNRSILYTREVYAPERCQPFRVGDFDVAELYSNLQVSTLLRSYKYESSSSGNEIWKTITTLLPHASYLNVSSECLQQTSQVLGPLKIPNLHIQCAATFTFPKAPLSDFINFETLKSLHVRYTNNYDLYKEPAVGSGDLFTFLEAIYNETNNIHWCPAKGTDSTMPEDKENNSKDNAVEPEAQVNTLNDDQYYDCTSVDDLNYQDRYKEEINAVRNVDETGSNIDETGSNIDEQYDDYLFNVNDSESVMVSDSKAATDIVKENGEDESTIDLYSEALCSERHEFMNHLSPRVVAYMQSAILAAKDCGNVLDKMAISGLQCLLIDCNILMEEEWRRLCKLMENWTSLRRIFLGVDRISQLEDHAIIFPRILIHKIKFGYLTHLNLSRMGDALMEVVPCLLIAFFELYREDAHNSLQPLEFFGLDWMMNIDSSEMHNVRLADLYPSHPSNAQDELLSSLSIQYQIKAVKQVSLTESGMSSALRNNFEHFLSCNVSLEHLHLGESTQRDGYGGMHCFLPRLSQIDMLSMSSLETIILSDVHPRLGGEITLILQSVPQLKQLLLRSSEVFKDINDEFLSALADHQCLIELDIKEDNLASQQCFLDVVLKKRCLRSLTLMECKLKGSTLLSALEKACHQLPYRHSSLITYLNLRYNFVTFTQLQHLKRMLKGHVKILDVDCSKTQFSANNEFLAQM